MASTKAKETTVIVPVSEPECVYSTEELAANYKLFGTSRAIVVVAMKKSGKTSATMNEAKEIIEKFKNKEVK